MTGAERISLEGAICDMVSMTSIACRLVEDLHDEQRAVLAGTKIDGREPTGRQLLNQCRELDDDLSFTIYHIRAIASDLKKAFYGKKLDEVS